MTEIEKHIQALRDTNMDVRQNAAETLVKVGTPAVPALIGLLKDTEWYVRRRAAYALGEIGDASAIPALIASFNDTNWDVRGSVAVALGWIGDASAVPALIEALNDTDEYVRYYAAMALGRIEPTEVLVSERLNPTEKCATLVALSKVRYNENGLSLNYKIGDVDRFCRQLCDDPNTDEKVRRGALGVINTSFLLRPSSEANFSSAELLRPSKSTPETNAEKELVRASDIPTETEQEKQRPKSLLARLFGR